MPAFYPSYLSTASQLLDAYTCGFPFASYLKTFFSKNKKFGSRDRRIISELCYGALRIGRSMDAYSLKERILVGYYLCNDYDIGCVELEMPQLASSLTESHVEKLRLLQNEFPLFSPHDIFPLSDQLSPSINQGSFVTSHLQKPAFFLRTLTKSHKRVVQALEQSRVPFTVVSSNTIRINDQVNLADQLEMDKDCFVQDISSQETLSLAFDKEIVVHSIWDACCGSGGKLLLASTYWPQASFFASDIRTSILDELHRRTDRFGLSSVHSFCMDLSQSLSVEAVKSNLPADGIDLIIADVPCTGSGTWSRNPEWLSCLELEEVIVYQERQKKIVGNLAQIAKKGSHILYITCSVFKIENEDVVHFMQTQCGLTLIKQHYFQGFDQGGDTLFVALLTL